MNRRDNLSCRVCILSGIIFLFSSTIIKPSIANAESFLDALKNYCVPTSADICTTNVATYKNGQCECPTIEQYYDRDNTRGCKDCTTGSFATSNFRSCEPIVCPAGYVATLITDGKCPSGYSLQQVKGGACPSGYALNSYNPKTKKWN